jgi:hypothetical protein
LNSKIPEENKIELTLNYNQEEVFQPLVELKQFNSTPKPFLIVLASGLEHLDTIRNQLEIARIGIESEHNIDNFETFARYIYPIVPEKPHSHLWLMVNRELYGDSAKGRALVLPSNLVENYEYIVQVKRYIRKVIGIQNYQTIYNGEISEISFHHLHAPDLDELVYQYNCLLNFSNSLIEP